MGRLFLDAQLVTVFEEKQRPVLERTSYIAALKAADVGGDMAQLVNLLAFREGIPPLPPGEKAPTPFRLQPFLIGDEEPTLAEELARSVAAPFP